MESNWSAGADIAPEKLPREKTAAGLISIMYRFVFQLKNASGESGIAFI
jgi:hypothetical protein